MGLRFTEDLEAWHRWQRSRQSSMRRLKHRLRPGPAPTMVVEVPDEPRILVALDSWSPTSALALQAPLTHLDPSRVAVLRPPGPQVLPGHLERELQGEELRAGHAPPPELQAIRVVAALGNYLPYGALAHQWSTQLDVPFVVVQHGLLTPLMAPLPRGSVLLAWSEADAHFWTAGRQDVQTQVVGSELLTRASELPARSVDPTAEPVFLGQLHGAELPRRGLARVAGEFCATTGATYRPHPAERDVLSRLQHHLWERRGITVERGGPPLADLQRPVVSAFSTGVLEAAARGLPAWVHYPGAPPWLEEFWDRYGMSRWGSEPTPSPVLDRSASPSVAVAHVLARSST